MLQRLISQRLGDQHRDLPRHLCNREIGTLSQRKRQGVVAGKSRHERRPGHFKHLIKITRTVSIMIPIIILLPFLQAILENHPCAAWLHQATHRHPQRVGRQICEVVLQRKRNRGQSEVIMHKTCGNSRRIKPCRCRTRIVIENTGNRLSQPLEPQQHQQRT